jgi:hypothetical protein
MIASHIVDTRWTVGRLDVSNGVSREPSTRVLSIHLSTCVYGSE